MDTLCSSSGMQTQIADIQGISTQSLGAAESGNVVVQANDSEPKRVSSL
jgi:hypothetical protein